jgi:hypothetical protein
MQDKYQDPAIDRAPGHMKCSPLHYLIRPKDLRAWCCR